MSKGYMKPLYHSLMTVFFGVMQQADGNDFINTISLSQQEKEKISLVTLEQISVLLYLARNNFLNEEQLAMMEKEEILPETILNKYYSLLQVRTTIRFNPEKLIDGYNSKEGCPIVLLELTTVWHYQILNGLLKPERATYYFEQCKARLAIRGNCFQA